MLFELKNVDQKEPGIHRRWFLDNYFELITWARDNQLIGFQLCYDRLGHEKCLTWKKDEGYIHDTVDDGHVSAGMHMTAILVQDGPVPVDMLYEQFQEESSSIDEGIRKFVLEKLQELQKKTPQKEG